MGCEETGVLQAQLMGIVYDATTLLPISNAVISSPCWIDYDVESGTDGTFSFPVVSQGIYDFHTIKEGYVEKINADVELLPTAVKYLEIALDQVAMSVSGTVTIKSPTENLTGAVVSNVVVSLTHASESPQNKTTSDGAFSFSISKPGSYTITARKTIADVTYKATLTGITISQGASISGLLLEMQKQ